MYKNKKILAIVPARGGSKRIPGKNMRILGNKPLIGWTLVQAKASEFIDTIVVSSDDYSTLEYAKSSSVEGFKRSDKASRDLATAEEVIVEILSQYHGYEYFVYLQPTSPLRRDTDIDSAIRQCLDGSSMSCVSVVKSNILPYWFYRIEEQRMLPYIAKTSKVRQELPVPFLTNGAVYVCNIDYYMITRNLVDDNTLAYEMSEQSSLDIDSEFDFKMAEMLING